MEIFIDALNDTGRLVPLLALIYFIVGFLEYRYGERMGDFMVRFGVFGPVVGALFGCIPQCGFSVVASALYVKRLISVGTLIAVFLSTSDEAVPVLLSMPDRVNVVISLILIKVMIAVFAGIGIDLVISGRAASRKKEISRADALSHSAIETHSGCCSHQPSSRRSKIKALVIHPLWHTVKIVLFLFLLTLALNYIINKIGEARIGAALLSGTVFQPVVASFIGMIPNCFSSVLLAKLFLGGVISFGSLIAGLCAGSGLGPLVLIKENKNLKDSLLVIGTLLTISISLGIAIQLIF